MPKIILFVTDNTDKVFDNENICCYMVADDLLPSKIKEIIDTKKMVLSIGKSAFDVCKQYNLDGVVKEIDVNKPIKIQLKSLRENLKGKTLGVIIPARRHEAMLAGEIEPEFIAFYSNNKETDQQIIDWYNELFLMPAAWVIKNNEYKEEISDVDFVIIQAKNFENFGC